jgi:FixJ family two-component response regulator
LAQRSPIVAVVDDHESIRQAVGSLLRSFGLQVVAFGSGEEFLRWPYVSSLACAVLDASMPGMSGLEVLQQLLERDPPLPVPVIFVSALDEPHTRAKAFAAGALAFLSKPFAERSLIEPIRSAIGRTHAELRRTSEAAVRRGSHERI